MNFFKRARLYMIRKRGKSILLFIILFIMATAVLTGLALAGASDTAQKNLKKSLGGKFQISPDYSESNPHMHTEIVEDNAILYPLEQITPEIVEQIKAIDGVTACDATCESLLEFDKITPFPGNIPIDEQFIRSLKCIGTWRSEDSTQFTGGELQLDQGRHISEKDTFTALISRDLAEKNNLAVGDTLSIKNKAGETFNIEIIGLFSQKQLERFNEQVTTYDKIQNQIFLDLKSMIAIENSDAITGFLDVTVTVDEPENIDRVIEDVKKIPGIDWSGYPITVDNAVYDSAAAALTQMSGLVTTFLLIILIVGAVVLSLILTLWARGRVHETGILLSIGISKISILGQYIAEVLIIAVAAFLLSYFSSGAIADNVGHLLLAQTPATTATAAGDTNAAAAPSTGDIDETAEPSTGDIDETTEPSVYGNATAAASGRDDTATTARSGNNKDGDSHTLPAGVTSVEMDIHIRLLDMVLLFAAGITVVILSAGIASISVMRMKPGEILAKMS